jgi:hypothetical protein
MAGDAPRGVFDAMMKAPSIGKMPMAAAGAIANRIPFATNTQAAVRGATGLGAAAAGELGSMVADQGIVSSPAQAQEKAYAGAPTLSWALQSVLTSGAGLPPKDEQELTEALIKGDTQRLASLNYRLQQTNPAFQKRMEDELRSLGEEEN